MSTHRKSWARPAITVAALGAAVAIPLAFGLGDEAHGAEGELERFPTCGALTEYASNAAIADVERQVRAFDIPMPSVADATAGTSGERSASPAPIAGQDYSTTNVQNAGIDEPDIVKTDGKRIFAIANGKIHAVDPSGARPRLLGSLGLGNRFTPSDLLLAGDRVLVVGTAFTAMPDAPLPAPAPGVSADDGTVSSSSMTVPRGTELGGTTRTVIAAVDVTDPERMRIIDRLSTDAGYSSARLRDGSVRLVLTGPRPRYPLSYRTGFSGAFERALAVRELKAMDVSSWLPSYRIENGDGSVTGDAVIAPCDAVSRPIGPPTGVGTVTVLTIDPARGVTPVDQDTVIGASDEVMMSADNLYVTSYAPGDDLRSTTRIHVFDVSRPRTTEYRASGSVEGSLLNQFSMDEHDGVLRVATTRGDGGFVLEDTAAPGSRGGDSIVTTLRVQGRRLTPIGRVEGLGRGERIYAVRFMGDRGYVVTFRQTDPLYTIDLSDPDAPRMTGELKINGYSAYLHPIDENHVLGVGQDATEMGQRFGAQVSLFDVSDPASPKRIAQWSAPGTSSGVEWDHHAFLWWKPTRTAVIPLSAQWDRDVRERGSAVALTVTESSIDNPRTLTQGPGTDGRESTITRSLVIGDRLYTLSDDGLVSRSLERLDDGEWLPLG